MDPRHPPSDFMREKFRNCLKNSWHPRSTENEAGMTTVNKRQPEGACYPPGSEVPVSQTNVADHPVPGLAGGSGITLNTGLSGTAAVPISTAAVEIASVGLSNAAGRSGIPGPSNNAGQSGIPGPSNDAGRSGMPGPSNANFAQQFPRTRSGDMSIDNSGRTISMSSAQDSMNPSLSNASKGQTRRADPVYNFVKPVAGTDVYQCKPCGKILGKRSSTRFRKHCVLKCDRMLSPDKDRLERASRSKQLRGPRVRSLVGLALERGGNDEIENPSLSNPSDSNFGSQVLTGATLGMRKIAASGRLARATIGSVLTRKRKNHTTDEAEAHISAEQVQDILTSIMELIVLKGRPFNMFDSFNGQLSPDAQQIHDLNPAFMDHLPNSRALSGRLLNNFYENMKVNVANSINSALSGGFGSIIFDGWDDVNSCPVVNVLLRTEGPIDIGRRIFFLKSVYTGSKTTGATEYVRIIEDVMGEYRGFERICAVTSDSTSSCVNTRKELTAKYMGIVGVNDQSHVADLLIEDMGKVEWIQDVISKVSYVAKELHKHRKLKERYRSLMSQFNEHVGSFCNQLSGDPHDRHDISGVTEDIPIRRSGFGGDRNPAILSRNQDERIRTAVMLRLSSNTRFASAEGVLESFYRSLEVLRKLVDEEDFDILFKPKSVSQRKKRDEKFTGVIRDTEFEVAVRDTHKLLALLRCYLRTFDSDDSRISEVLPYTLELECALRTLPITEVFTEERKNEVLNVFNRRRDGIDSSVTVCLLEDVHYVAFMLDPNLASDNTMIYMDRFRKHAYRFAMSKESTDTDAVVQDLITSFIRVREMWRIDREGAQRRIYPEKYRGNALMWWYARNCADARLTEFATRSLSCSPTSCSVERSFSAQKMIHPKQRNRLSRDKVQKMIFCHWNIKLMKKLKVFDSNRFWESVGGAMAALSTANEPYETSEIDNESDTESVPEPEE